MTTRTTAHTDTRSRILAAAARRLQSAPLEELTLAAVARSAGVSRQTVYTHFRDRDDLAASVFIGYADEHFENERAGPLSGTLDGEALEAVFWADVDAARAFFTDSASLETTELRSRIAEFILGSPRMRDFLIAVWLPVLERFREARSLRADLDLAETAWWLGYQQTWLVAYPAPLGDDAQARRRIRTYVIDPLLVASGRE